ncbi:hypothetical protein SAMN02745146_2708 [Hymenobacter daecheongensis DSM 21074]|uniref:Uncharacterized protein n=1 Tax=Hymenobacter daecheongensis DSM 21074 TaxID=1121955 RepID=A0A1M6HYR7_9BACT|nr:hypothetical protein SAMN02745146_2708 [Hymenobacter daecheongensis DSM 21074]
MVSLMFKLRHSRHLRYSHQLRHSRHSRKPNIKLTISLTHYFANAV